MILDEAGKPIYPHTIAKEFPILPVGNLVERQNMLETMSRMFEETDVIFLEGGEGFGATTTAAQFCRAFPDTSIALFVKSASRITYSTDYLRLVLAEQISWLLDTKELGVEVIEPTAYQNYLRRLGRRASRKTPIYFVIDGLAKIPTNENAVSEIFKELLPLGVGDIKFLITAKAQDFERYLPDISSKYIQQLRFSSAESAHFLGQLTISRDESLELHSLCDGVPGRLASVQRLLVSGVSVKELLEAMPSKFLGFVKLEFESVSDLSTEAKQLLALITFSNRQIDRDDLVSISKIPAPAQIELFEKCKFLTVPAQGKPIEFVSDAHRKFASTLLNPSRKSAVAAHIAHLASDLNSKTALKYR